MAQLQRVLLPNLVILRNDLDPGLLNTSYTLGLTWMSEHKIGII
jgi:hypothetical protein